MGSTGFSLAVVPKHIQSLYPKCSISGTQAKLLRLVGRFGRLSFLYSYSLKRKRNANYANNTQIRVQKTLSATASYFLFEMSFIM